MFLIGTVSAINMHEDILRNIKCRTVFMKAHTNISKDDLKNVSELIFIVL